MSVYYGEKPSADASLCRWHENFKYLDIWYDEVISVGRPGVMIPEPLSEFLAGWREKMKEYMKSYRESYPVKMAKIEFIYQDNVYAIYPKTVGATYESTFMSETPYEVSWDSLFEEYQKQIREELARCLGVTHSRYSGYLD